MNLRWLMALAFAVACGAVPTGSAAEPVRLEEAAAPGTDAVQVRNVLSAEDAVRLAMARPEVELGIAAGVDLARSEVIDARTWANPELQIERERADGPADDATETSFLLSQQIDLGGRRGLRRRAAELGVDAARAEAEAERRRLRAEVLRRYYAVVVAEQRVQAYVEWHDSLEELARIATRRNEAGDLSGFDSRRIGQSSAQAAARRAEAETGRNAAREQLAAAIGVPARNAPVDMHTPVLPQSLPPQPSDALRTAELAALDSRRAEAEAAAHAAGRWALPVTVGVGQKRYETLGARDDALLLELSVPLPLFDRNQAASARARAEAQRAQSHYRLALGDARARRNAAWEEVTWLTATAQRLRDETVPQANELTAIARASFAEGELDLVGLLDAFDAQIEVVDQSLDLQYRARAAAIELEQSAEFEPSTPLDPLTQGELP